MQIRHLVQTIQSREEPPLNISELAALSGYRSPFHFLRVCRQRYGVGPGKLSELIRLHKGLFLIRYRPWLSVMDVALICGYDTTEGFSRAFKRTFGVSPSSCKRGATIYQPPMFVRINQIIQGNEKGRDMTESDNWQALTQIITQTEIPVCVLRHQGSPTLLHRTIGQFIGWRRANRLSPDKFRTFNFLYHDPCSVEPNAFCFDLACEIPSRELEHTADKRFTVIPAGRFAKVHVQGNDAQLESAIRYVTEDFCAQQNEVAADHPVIVERVKSYPDVPANDALCIVYLLLDSVAP